jgi:hypothetical protein
MNCCDKYGKPAMSVTMSNSPALPSRSLGHIYVLLTAKLNYNKPRDTWSTAHQQGQMQAHNNTILLVWGLFDNKRCTAHPLAATSGSKQYVMPDSGWNLPASLLESAGTTPVKQLALGWSYALLLTQQGDAFIAQASKVLHQARYSPDIPSCLQALSNLTSYSR